MGRFVFWGITVIAVTALSMGCSDPLTNHRVLSVFFDGVPSPSVEEICRDHLEELCEGHLAGTTAEGGGRKDQGQEAKALQSGSKHPPYAEKKCDGCHNPKANNRLIQPKEKLCFVCHKDFVKGRHIHGPVAVSDCLVCHRPHDSRHDALLIESREAICSRCHVEKRLAAVMHDRVAEHRMICVDCHDPHSADIRYFLK